MSGGASPGIAIHRHPQQKRKFLSAPRPACRSVSQFPYADSITPPVISIAGARIFVLGLRISVSRSWITVYGGRITVSRHHISVSWDQITVSRHRVSVSEGRITVSRRRVGVSCPRIAVSRCQSRFSEVVRDPWPPSVAGAGGATGAGNWMRRSRRSKGWSWMRRPVARMWAESSCASSVCAAVSVSWDADASPRASVQRPERCQPSSSRNSARP